MIEDILAPLVPLFQAGLLVTAVIGLFRLGGWHRGVMDQLQQLGDSFLDFKKRVETALTHIEKKLDDHGNRLTHIETKVDRK